MKVLIIEDDREQAEFVKLALTQAGFECECAYDGEEGRYMLLNHDYAVAIVDNMMPKLRGTEVIHDVRKALKNPPVMIMLSQCVHEQARVSGLEAGAVDYICKPFSMDELVARIKVQLRLRYPECEDAIIRFDNVVLDTLKHEVLRDGHFIKLEPREYGLFEYLMRNIGRFVSSRLILDQVWDMRSSGTRATVDVRLCTLRKKLNQYGRNIIITRKGCGYGIE